MKMNVQITKIESGLMKTEEKIADIDICNGNWKYWDNMMESDDKIALTINTIRESFYLSLPVKDEYKFLDHDAWEEDREIIYKDVSIRTYDNLLSYLNCRINNVKEDWKSGSYKLLDYNEKGGETFECYLYEENSGKYSEDSLERNIVFEKQAKLIVKIEVIE